MARTRKTTQPSLKPAPTQLLSLLTTHDNQIVFYPETGGRFIGSEAEINAVLSAMGYAQIAVRRNLLSGKPYIEARDTPLSCSPASETYWSM